MFQFRQDRPPLYIVYYTNTQNISFESLSPKSTYLFHLCRRRSGISWTASGWIFCGKAIMEKEKLHLMEWDMVIKPRELGGLGLWCLEAKNWALLVKWLWRFGKEKKTMWRKVIVAKYVEEESEWVPSIVPRYWVSGLWWNILKFEDMSSIGGSVFKGDGFQGGRGKSGSFIVGWLVVCGLMYFSFPLHFGVPVNGGLKSVNILRGWEALGCRGWLLGGPCVSLSRLSMRSCWICFLTCLFVSILLIVATGT